VKNDGVAVRVEDFHLALAKIHPVPRGPANNSRDGGRERVRRESDVSKLLRRRNGRKVLPTGAQVPDS
jgi:hypothetical protein